MVRITALLMTVALLAACAAEEPGRPGAGAGRGAGNRLVISQIDESGDMISINPLGNHVPLPTSLVYDNLVRLDPERGGTVPRLASSVAHPDPTTWVFRLREGVRFHDGSTFDAQDVAATLEWVRDDANGSGYRRFIATIAQVEVTDPATVTLRTSLPDSLLDRYLVQVPMLSSDQLTEGEDIWQSQLLGTGPYRFKSWDQGQQVVVEANREYWDTAAAPTWDEVEVNAVPEPSTRLADLRAGVAGLVGDVLPEQVDEFEAAGAKIVVEAVVSN